MTDAAGHDIELTTSALKAGPTDLGVHGGLVELRRWEDRLAGDGSPELQQIGGMLAELRGELESDAPSAAAVADLMRRLGDATLTVAGQAPADAAPHLRELGNLLRQGASEVG